MSVYVDDMRAAYGRMVMCHMIADTTEELLAMADQIGVQRKWLQRQGSHREHFDIAQSKRALALKHGAQAITQRELAKLILVKRAYVMAAREEGAMGGAR
jgi:hypothetical protein